MFSKAVELAPKNYDAIIGLGIALRGLNDLDGAEAATRRRQQLDPRSGEAYYNLGVLYKDFRATKQEDLQGVSDMYDRRSDFFQQFLDKDGAPTDKAEAKEQHRRLRQDHHADREVHQEPGEHAGAAPAPTRGARPRHRRWHGSAAAPAPRQLV